MQHIYLQTGSCFCVSRVFFVCIIQADCATKYVLAVIKTNSLKVFPHSLQLLHDKRLLVGNTGAAGIIWSSEVTSLFKSAEQTRAVAPGVQAQPRLKQDYSSLWKLCLFSSLLSGNLIPHYHRTDCGKAISPPAS